MFPSLRGARFRTLRAPLARAVSRCVHAASSVRFRAAFRCASLLLLAATAVHISSAQALEPGGPVDFGSVPLGSSSYVTLVFSAGVPTTITSITAVSEGLLNRDFGIATQNCTGYQAPPSSCSITLVFAPQQIGLAKGSLAIKDGTGTVVNRVPLHGIGVGGQFVYAPSTVTAKTTLASLTPSTFKPSAAVFDSAGNLYFNDITNGRILKQATDGTVTLVATLPGNAFSSMTFSGEGTLYVSSPSQGVVYAIPPGGGTPSTLSTGSITLISPAGLLADGLGFLYIADSGANKIIRIQLNGNSNAALSLTGLAQPLSSPSGLALDGTTLYIADSGHDRIVKLSLVNGAAAPVSSSVGLSNPHGLAVDAAGSLYVADTGSGRLILIPATGVSFALLVPGQGITTPTGVAVASNGDLGVPDTAAGLVSVARASHPIVFPTPTKVGTLDTVDGTQSFTLQNTGNVPAQLVVPTGGTNPYTTKAFLLTSPSTCPLLSAASPAGAPNSFALGAVCSYAVQFSPTNTGANNSNLSFNVVDGSGAALPLITGVTLSGVGTSSLTGFTLSASPSVTSIGAPVSYTVTALSKTGLATDYLGTVTFTTTDATAKFLSGNTYVFTAADAGTHTFTAPAGVQFNALGTFTLSVADNAITGTSNPVQVVNQPTLTIATATTPVFLGNPVQLGALVASPGANPTGNVTFYDAGIPIGTATLSGGFAQLSTTFSTVGTHTITASYSGDANFLPATSPSLSEVVQDFTLAPAPNVPPTLTVAANTATAWTFLVTPVGGNTFPAPITFSVTGLPKGTLYTFTPATVPTGNGNTNVTLSFTPPPNTAFLHTLPQPFGRPLVPVTLAVLLLPLAAFGRRRRVVPALLLLVLGVSCTGLTGCLSDASSGYSAQLPRSYPIVVTATSGQLSHSTSLTLTVE